MAMVFLSLLFWLVMPKSSLTKSLLICTSDAPGSPVCGSDGALYASSCEFLLAKQQQPRIQEAVMTICLKTHNSTEIIPSLSARRQANQWLLDRARYWVWQTTWPTTKTFGWLFLTTKKPFQTTRTKRKTISGDKKNRKRRPSPCKLGDGRCKLSKGSSSESDTSSEYYSSSDASEYSESSKSAEASKSSEASKTSKSFQSSESSNSSISYESSESSRSSVSYESSESSESSISSESESDNSS